MGDVKLKRHTRANGAEKGKKMFITSKNRSYTRYGQQRASGKFLAVFSHNESKAEEQSNPVVPGPVLMDWIKADRTTVCTCAGNPYYYQKSCPVHAIEYRVPEVPKKLYAVVRHCVMSQCGHWMMGTINIAGQRVTVSGSYGADGLPMDYEDLAPAARSKVVEVPEDLAEVFWRGGGHNCAGSEAPAMRHWAIANC